MYYILCKDLTTNSISKSERLFFSSQVESILEELNNRKDNCIYYKQLFSWE